MSQLDAIATRLADLETKMDRMISILTGDDEPGKGMLFRLTMLEKDKVQSGLIINWLVGTLSLISATVIGELIVKFYMMHKGG